MGIGIFKLLKCHVRETTGNDTKWWSEMMQNTAEDHRMMEQNGVKRHETSAITIRHEVVQKCHGVKWCKYGSEFLYIKHYVGFMTMVK